jgi:NADH dehydrogenase/NADH:ubiquinone oxidoreductase subunit G
LELPAVLGHPSRPLSLPAQQAKFEACCAFAGMDTVATEALALACPHLEGRQWVELRRIENRFNGSVNQYFLCDRGRFGYGYVNNADRPRQPLLAGQAIGIDAALDKAAELLNGRLAMLGLIAVVSASMASGMDILEVVNIGVGGLLLAK